MLEFCFFLIFNIGIYYRENRDCKYRNNDKAPKWFGYSNGGKEAAAWERQDRDGNPMIVVEVSDVTEVTHG